MSTDDWDDIDRNDLGDESSSSQHIVVEDLSLPAYRQACTDVIGEAFDKVSRCLL